MKKSILILFTSLIFSGIVAQEEETIAISEEACECMETIVSKTEKKEKYDAIKSCISSAIFSYQLKKGLENIPKKVKDTTNKIPELLRGPSVDTSKQINIEIVTDKNFTQIESFLLLNCVKMKSLMQTDETLGENTMSDNQDAIDYYNNGQKFYTNKEYEKAINEYEKAIKVDKNFAFAFDKLGYSHRQLGHYKKALKYYNKSLKLNPKGRMALMNKPIVYQLMGDFEKAIESYKVFISTYSNDAEGFYGIGIMYFTIGNYEEGVENMMKAYWLYNEMNSPYIRDAEKNLVYYYNELKEKNQLGIFQNLAEKYDIKIQE